MQLNVELSILSVIMTQETELSIRRIISLHDPRGIDKSQAFCSQQWSNKQQEQLIGISASKLQITMFLNICHKIEKSVIREKSWVNGIIETHNLAYCIAHMKKLSIQTKISYL